MRFDEKKIVLRDGRRAVLRLAEAADAEAMVKYLTDTAAETEFVLRYPEECDRYTVEKERELLEAFRQDPNHLMLCCFVEDELAGNCSLQILPQLKCRHRASVAIALYRRFWELGIGTAMFDAMIRVAREKGVKQLELEYIDGNARAKALYEKMGFVRVAEHPDAIQLKDGSMRKLVLMIKRLTPCSPVPA